MHLVIRPTERLSFSVLFVNVFLAGARSPGERGSTFVSIRVSLCLLLMFWSLFYIPMDPTILTYLSLLYFFSYLFLPLFTARSPGEPIVNPEGTQHLSDHLLLPSSIPWFLHSFYFLYRTISCTVLFHVHDYFMYRTIVISWLFHWCSTWHYCRSPDFPGDLKDGGSVWCHQRMLHTISHVDMQAVSRCRKA